MFTIHGHLMVFIGHRKECNRQVSLTRVSRIEGHSTIQFQVNSSVIYHYIPGYKQTLDTNPGPQYRSVKARKPRITGFPLKMPRERYGF